uniref:G protein-coupled receptor 153 n=1 Tax=Eptatretus burgeri TaxID=7764 RepID=A0A8C4Q7J0_EPTBU
MQTLADERGGPFAGQSLPWLICALVAAGANTWAVLALTARQSKWKPLELLMCALGGAHALNTALPIAMYAVLQLRKRASASYQWNEGLCKVFVSSFYTLTLVTCFMVTSLAYHRMWMVRWPVNYRLGEPRKQVLQTLTGVWLVAFLLCALPAVGWHDTSQRFYHGRCDFIVAKVGLGFAVCFLLLLAGGLTMGMVCIAVALVQTLRARRHSEPTVPRIVVEDVHGKRRASLDGSEPPRTSRQLTALVTALVLLYTLLAGAPMLAVSLVSVRDDIDDPWMIAVMVWCSLGQALIFPSALTLCKRYRAGWKAVRTVCISLLASDDDEWPGKRLHYDAGYEDANFEMPNGSEAGPAGDETCDGRDNMAEYFPETFTLHRLRHVEQMQFLQVPPIRRFSQDDDESWQGGHLGYLPHWGLPEGTVPSESHTRTTLSGCMSVSPQPTVCITATPDHRRRLSEDYSLLPARRRDTCVTSNEGPSGSGKVLLWPPHPSMANKSTGRTMAASIGPDRPDEGRSRLESSSGSFLSLPSASSGYLTYLSGSIGSGQGT